MAVPEEGVEAPSFWEEVVRIHLMAGLALRLSEHRVLPRRAKKEKRKKVEIILNMRVCEKLNIFV